MIDGLPGPLKELKLMVERGAQSAPLVQQTEPPKRTHGRFRMVVALLEAGYSPATVKMMTGYSLGRVRQINAMRHPKVNAIRMEVQKQLVDSIQDVGHRFKAVASEALTVQIGLMRQEDDKNVRRLASKFILEVAGYSPVKKQFNVGTQVPPDQFIEAVARMEQADAARDRKDEWAFKLPEAKDANCG